MGYKNYTRLDAPNYGSCEAECSEAATARAGSIALRSLTLSGSTGTLYDVKSSREGSRLGAANADGTARICDASTGVSLLTLRGHTDELRGVALRPDGAYVASGSVDDTAKVWVKQQA